MYRRLIYVVGLLVIGSGLHAQQELIREGSAEQRRAEIESIQPDQDRRTTLRRADSLKLATRIVYPDGRVVAIRGFNSNLNPEYLTTHNLNAARTVSTNKVWAGGGLGFSLDGNGLVVGVWDAGIPRSTHIEFDNRALIIDGTAEIDGHATHVSGTIGAAGLNELAKGMAEKVVLEAYDWNQDMQEMQAAASRGLLLSNHSYGYVVGWSYDDEEERWEWHGDLVISEEEDYNFGFYHRDAATYDRIAYRNPYYLIVKSAGNDRGEGPSPGTEHYVYDTNENDWVASTAVRQRDGGDDGFDSMGPVGNAKNILAVGAVKDMPAGYTGPDKVKLESYSSFGPTDDGRIKPDLVANGDRLLSPYSGSDEEYRNSSGTSMSAPNVTGSLALIQQQHFDLFGTYLTSAGLKGLVLHTADDAGNPGPDYKYGWGLLNTYKAVELISDEQFDRVQESSLSEGGEHRIKLYSSGEEPIKISLCWTDPQSSPPLESLDPIDPMLVNDLDIRLIRLLDGEEIHPFILDPLHPEKEASRGNNVLDNVEQILEENPIKGFYEVIISQKGSLTGERQDFSLVFSGLTDEFFASGVKELSDNNGAFKLTSAPEYLPDMDPGWLIEPENGLPVTLYFEFFATEAQKDLLYIFDGPDENSPLLAQLDGTLNVDTLELNSTSGQLFVRFLSDSINQDRGFSGTYCTTAPEDTALIQGKAYPCSGNTELYLATGVSGVEYLWNAPPGWSVDSLISDGAYLGVGPDEGILGVVVTNRCGSGPESMKELIPLNSVPVLKGFLADTLPCAAVTSMVAVDSIQGAAYEWKLPAKWLGSSSTHLLEYVPGYESGSIQLMISNACGFGDTLTIPIAVQTKPGEVQILTSRDKPCALSSQEFYVNPEEEYDYRWETIDDWTILGPENRDTVLVAVGAQSSFLFVNATNKCGTRQSNKIYLTSPVPDKPLMKVNDSEYEGYKLLTVTNPSSFTAYQWHLNSQAIESSLANGPSYVAYLPGLYTVEVTNSDGCSLLQKDSEGIEIFRENQVFSVFAGTMGHIAVLNSTSATATLKIYDFNGKLLLIKEINPGYNEIYFGKEGAFILSVTGSGYSTTSRIFTY